MSIRSTWFRWCLAALAASTIGLAPTAARADASASACDLWLPTQPSRAPARIMEGVGRAHLQISTRSGEAQKFFDQGLALLQEGWPFEADHSFAEAARLDPKCAMAQWGIAMAGLNDARRDSAVARAQELAAGASPPEQLYIAAVQALNAGGLGAGSGAFAVSTEAYRRALRKIVGKYSNDVTAKLLLAQALVAGYEADGTPRAGTLEAIALCEVALNDDPRSAAAHHTLAHAYESSPWPEKGARSADQFVKSAPAVAHALHLAGQLALRMDRGDDAVRALEGAAGVDEAYMRKESRSSSHTSGPYNHNLSLLATVYGDQGRYRDALRTASRLLEQARRPGEAGTAAALDGRLALMRTLVRFGRWSEILDGRTLPDDGGIEVLKAWRHYALGRAWIGRRDVEHAWAELVALDGQVTRLKRELPKSATLRPLQDRQMLSLLVAPLELKGRILAREGMGDAALATLRQGLELETKSAVSEPGLALQTMDEAIGDVASDLGLWDDAIGAYQAAHERAPGDGRALLGLARAFEGAGKKHEGAVVREELARRWAHADPEAAGTAGGVTPSVGKPARSGATKDAQASAPKVPPPGGADEQAANAPQAASPEPRPEPVAKAPKPTKGRRAPPQAAADAPPPDPYAAKLKKTRVNGAQLAYVDIGKGEPIVLVHGSLADYREWTPQIEGLSKHYRVIAYSRRFHYPNPPADARSEYSYAENEQDLVGLIRGLHLGKVHLLGHGYGAFVATLAARDHPELVRTLMLAEPGVYSMIPLKKERRAAIQGLKAAAVSSGEAVRAGDLELAAKQFYAAIEGSPGAFDSLPEPQRRSMRDNVATVLLSAETPPAFSCEDAQRITARTLLVEGDATPRLEHMALEGMVRCLPNRDRATIKGASRNVNLSQPDAFNGAVTHFIEAPAVPVQPAEDEEP